MYNMVIYVKNANYIFIISLILFVCLGISSVSANDTANIDSVDSNSIYDINDAVLMDSPDNIGVVDEKNVLNEEKVKGLSTTNNKSSDKITPTIKLKSSKISAYNGKTVKLSAKVVFKFNGVESSVGGGYLYILKDGKSIKKVDLTNVFYSKYVSINFKFKKGHKYSLWYSGAKDVGELGLNFNPTSKKLPITVKKVKTMISAVTTDSVKNHGYYKVKLTTAEGKALANKRIIMKSLVSGKKYAIKTNKHGVAKIDLWVKNKPINNYYKYKFMYAGSKNYVASSNTFSVKINDFPTKDITVPTKYSTNCRKTVGNYIIETEKFKNQDIPEQYVCVYVYPKNGMVDLDKYKVKVYYKNKGDKTFKSTDFMTPPDIATYAKFRFNRSLDIGNVVVRFL